MNTLDKVHSLKIKASEKISVLQQFRIYTFLAMIVIGISIIYSLNSYARNDFVNRLSDSSVIFAKSIPQNLEDKNVKERLSGNDYTEFDQFVRNNLLAEKATKSRTDILLALNVFNNKGKKIYGTHPEEVSTAHENRAKKSLKGSTINEIIHLTDKQKQQFSFLAKRKSVTDMVEVYTPLYSNSKKPFAVAELYLDATSVNRYMRRNMVIVSFIVATGLFLLYILLSWFFKRIHNKISQKNLELEKLTNKVMSSLKQLEESYLGTMQALTMAVDAKDHYTAGHTFRVSSFAREIGRVLGFTDEALDNLEKGARVHDIGKIGIRDNVLNKHGPLTKHEFSEMQRHTTIGAKILEPVKSLQSIVPIVRSHHERVDGTGYPDGLNGQSIPIEARIVAVADCFDAMTTDRPNRKAFPVAKAIEEIKDTSGTHFDKEIVDAFLIAYSGKQIWTDDTKTKNKKSA